MNLELSNLRRLKKFLNEELAILSFKQMVLPTFDYCDILIESGPEDLIKEIQTIQNHCLRCCLGIIDPRLISINDLHTECSCKKLLLRRRETLLCRMYKFSRVPGNCIVATRALRSNAKWKIKTQRPHGQLYRDSPLYRGVFLWDTLDAEVQNLPGLDQFLSKIRE